MRFTRDQARSALPRGHDAQARLEWLFENLEVVVDAETGVQPQTFRSDFYPRNSRFCVGVRENV